MIQNEKSKDDEKYGFELPHYSHISIHSFRSFNIYLLLYVIFIIVLDLKKKILGNLSLIQISFEYAILYFLILLIIVPIFFSYFEKLTNFIFSYILLIQILLVKVNVTYLIFSPEVNFIINLFSTIPFIIFVSKNFDSNKLIVFYALNIFEYFIINQFYFHLSLDEILMSLLLLIVIIYYLNNFDNKFEKEIRKYKHENDALRKSVEQSNLFLSKMSHNIRTPLNVVLNLVTLLKEDAVKIDPNCQYNSKRCSYIDDSILKNISTLDISANNLLSTVNDILDYEKILSGQLQVKNTEFMMTELVNDFNETYNSILKRKGLELIIINQGKIPGDKILYGNAVHLKQILLNLIDNAIKFTLHGNIELIYEISKRKSENSEAYSLQIIVSDTGIGIPKDKLNTLFRPFSQVNNSLNVNGTGLGLLIVSELIQINKGSLFISSEENEGTTFTIKFPVTISDDSAKHDENFSEAPYKNDFSQENTLDFKGLNLLFVDDYEDLHYLINQIFKHYPFKTDFAIDGNSALHKIENNTYDLVFLDIRMPGKDGIEVLDEIRNLEKRKGMRIPVVALTANALKDDIIKYKELGFNDVIVKPFTRESILKVITSIALLHQE